MVKGINRQVLEIRETGSPYFERAFFFVKPEFAFADEEKLRKAAERALQSTDSPPKTRHRRAKSILYWALGSGAVAAVGTVATVLLVR